MTGTATTDRWADRQRRRDQRKRIIWLAVLGAVLIGIVVWQFPKAAERFAWNCGATTSVMSTDDIGQWQDLMGFRPIDGRDLISPNDWAPTAEELRELPSFLGTPMYELLPDLRRQEIDDAGAYVNDPRVWVTANDTLVITTGGTLPGTVGSYRVLLADPQDGVPRWGIATTGAGVGGGSIGSLFLTTGTSASGNVDYVSYDRETGEQLACTRFEGDDGWSPLRENARIDGTDLAVAYGTPDSGTEVSRFDVATGSKKWTLTAPQRISTIEANQDVIAVSRTNDLGDSWRSRVAQGFRSGAAISVLDGETGETLWNITTDPGHSEAVRYVSRDGLIVTSGFDGSDREGYYLRAYSPSGTTLWTIGWDGEDESEFNRDGAVRLADDILLVRDDSTIRGIDPLSGIELWSRSRTIDVEADYWVGIDLEDAAYTEGMIVNVTGNYLYVLDSTTGALEVSEQPMQLDGVEPTPDGWLLNGFWGSILTTDATPVPVPSPSNE